MDEKVFQIVEYTKIREQLTSFAVSPKGKELTSNLIPFTKMNDIINGQLETAEAVSMLLQNGTPPFGGFHEIRPQLKRAEMGGVLLIEELLDIGDFLSMCSKMKRYANWENKVKEYSILDPLFSELQPISSLQQEIERCIASPTELEDRASSALYTVRQEIRIANEKVKEKLNQVLTSSHYRNMLQDFVITIRNDRYCLPVKAEYRNSFSGLVHDQSNTGSTLFMEPMSVVQQNNTIKELQMKEKKEIEKILAYLSGLVSENWELLTQNHAIVSQLDFMFAKGALAVSQNASQPFFNTRGYVNIKQARHPLLKKQEVVPVDIVLGKDFTTLLITGPNTGGKTVTLKTLGLFTLMGQAGLMIPAKEHSDLAVFDQVFADIGDEQSIEQSLSTFSGHMRHIVSILQKVTPQSLVLFDELGAGTDPVEGAALAIAIIQHLKQSAIRTVVTTHYSELKVYALSTAGVENACCEFDIETLRPTYRLLIGVPGKSNAFAISQKLGLPNDIIASAQNVVRQEDAKLEDVITDLEISRKSLEEEQQRVEGYRKKIEALQQAMEEQQEAIQKQKNKWLAEARQEAKRIYQTAANEAGDMIKQMQKEMRKKPSSNQLADNRKKINNRLEEIEELIEKYDKRKKKNQKIPHTVKEGDAVYILSFDQRGVVVSPPNGNHQVMVQMGTMKMQIPLEELVLEEAPEKQTESAVHYSASQGKSQHISIEIDCRGQLVEEALGNVDKYLDDAYLAGLEQVTIIHGKGTGALRNAIWKFLKIHSHVEEYRMGRYGEGEMGVTVVTLKK